MNFADFIEQRRQPALAQMAQIQIAALIWGPTPQAATPVAGARVHLRNLLNERGHHARFSEDLLDPVSEYSVFAQQIAQAKAFDVVFSIPDSPGSIAELHDFARIPGVAPKIVAFLDQAWCGGYASQSLIQLESIATCRIQLYDASQLPTCVIAKATDMVRRLQEYYFAHGRIV